MLKSTLIAAAVAAALAVSAAAPASAAPVNLSALADAKPANELVQAGFKKKHFRLHIHVGGFGGHYGHYSGYGCRRLYWRWQHTGSWFWRKRYLQCIGAW